MHPNYDVKTNIWTFSVTNPDQVVNGSVPTVKSVGPYVYDQKFKRRVSLEVLVYLLRGGFRFWRRETTRSRTK